jgi:small subunit ribosomal protein S2
MALPEYSMRQLLEAGVHFGHQKHRWNPKMAQYIYGVRNNIHIMDLAQTVPMLHRALEVVSDAVAGGGRVLFVGTKRQASEPLTAAAKRSAQYYVNARWLGGMLTNWKTISRSIQRLRELETLFAGEAQGLTKKERLMLTREKDKLEKALGGIKDMGGVPNLLFVIDTNKEAIAIQEANRLGIPVVAVVDSNCDPDNIAYPIPGNDDAGRAITLYCDLVARAAIDGISRAQGEAGIDIGGARTGGRSRRGRRRHDRGGSGGAAGARHRQEGQGGGSAAGGAGRAALRDACGRSRRPQEDHGRRPGAREEAQCARHHPLRPGGQLLRRGYRQDRRCPQLQGPHSA